MLPSCSASGLPAETAWRGSTDRPRFHSITRTGPKGCIIVQRHGGDVSESGRPCEIRPCERRLEGRLAVPLTILGCGMCQTCCPGLRFLNLG